MKLQDDTTIGVVVFTIILVLAIFLFAKESAPDPCPAAPMQDYSNIQGC